MDSLDLFFKKYAYKFPKGYPDLNNEQDINVLANLLEDIGIDLSEKENTTQMSLPLDTSEKDTENFKQQFIDLINNTAETELEKDPIYKSLFKRLQNYKKELLEDFKIEFDKRNIGKLYKAIYNIAEETGEADNLYEYLISEDQLDINSLEKIGLLDNLYKNAKKYISKELFTVLAEKGDISIGNTAMGVGELIFILMLKNAKRPSEKGDLKVENNIYEIKGNNARFSSGGIGIGREGNISKVYSDLSKTYTVEPTNLFNEYIFNILSNVSKEQQSETISKLNNLLNQIYINSEEIKLDTSNITNPDSIKNILLKKYMYGYASGREGSNYILITKNNKYQILTQEEFLKNIINFKFTNITKSSAYPQIILQ